MPPIADPNPASPAPAAPTAPALSAAPAPAAPDPALARLEELERRAEAGGDPNAKSASTARAN